MTALPETAAVEADPTMQWLGDAPARSADALARLRATPPAPPTSTPPVDPSPPIDPGPGETPDPPSSPPVVGASFYHPVSEAECKATCRTCSIGALAAFDPTTRPASATRSSTSPTLAVRRRFKFNGAQFSWKGNDPTKQCSLRSAGPRTVAVDDGYFYGGGYGACKGARPSLHIGRRQSIWQIPGNTFEFGRGIEIAETFSSS